MKEVTEIRTSFDIEYVDECNSLFSAFKDAVTAYYLSLPPREDEEASVGDVW